MNPANDARVAVFACTNFRNDQRQFGIRQADRRSHMYVIGKSGTGKSTLIEQLLRQDIAAGQGAMLIDPHGDLVERVVEWIPSDHRDRLIYFNVPSPAQPFYFNPLNVGEHSNRALTGSFLLEAFKKLWPDSWGPRLEHILRQCLLVLLEQPYSTLGHIPRLLLEPGFRRDLARQATNPAVREFWLREYEAYPARLRADAIAPIQNKVGAFLANPVLQRILLQPVSSFDLRQVMDEGQLLMVNLAKGRIGEDACALLGALLISAVSVAALGRADIAERDRRDFFVFLDEFQTFSTLSLASMLSELRKYRVCLTLAHQHLAQLGDEVRAAILGNVGTLVAFRVGPQDAELLEAEFRPEIRREDLVNPPNHHVFLKLLVDGRVTRPFSASIGRGGAIGQSS